MAEKASKILPNEIKIEIINQKHDLTRFTSYEQDLVDFLRDDALRNQEQNLSVTFVWFYRNRLVSYITLLTDRISLSGKLQDYFMDKGVTYKTLPALKIGRLCVDDEFRGKGLGTLMLRFAVQIAKEINQSKAGCRFITVDAKRNPNPPLDSVKFYQKLPFKIFGENTKEKITFMCLDLKLV
ncbi:MAG: GNAT family N-acetyltransferase [Nanoarchaeota archaeon]